MQCVKRDKLEKALQLSGEVFEFDARNISSKRHALQDIAIHVQLISLLKVPVYAGSTFAAAY